MALLIKLFTTSLTGILSTTLKEHTLAFLFYLGDPGHTLVLTMEKGPRHDSQILYAGITATGNNKDLNNYHIHKCRGCTGNLPGRCHIYLAVWGFLIVQLQLIFRKKKER